MPHDETFPPIIQGGMGVAVSGWRLAGTVARRGMIGVVSGTGLDSVIARRLQLGDEDGSLRRAIARFPCRATAERALDRYFIPGGKAPEKAFKSPPMFRINPTADHLAFASLSAFVEVSLAKEGHDGPVGINLLEKIALPNPALLYGAMLAGVDYVLMGAGIPWQIPGILDSLSRHDPVALRVMVEEDGAADTTEETHFDPAVLPGHPAEPLRRPRFLAIISSATLAQALLKRATGRIDGFVVEAPTAGGHNAPPRGKASRSERGEPVYGVRDEIDLAKMRTFGLPFWLAGSQGDAGSLARARENGAAGIQVGTLFAFCAESGLDPVLRRRALEGVRDGTIDVFTDPLASPTGFPFKVVRLAGTLSEAEEYDLRPRVCDAGYLRRLYRLADGSVGYRCAAEGAADFAAKGGDPSETEGRKCLCNALLADVGVPQVRRTGAVEGTLMTAGDELPHLAQLLGDRLMDYTADDALDLLLAEVTPTVPA